MAAVNGTIVQETIKVPPRQASNGKAVKPDEREVTVDLASEYVASGRNSWYVDLVRALPRLIDEIQDDFGADIYDRMMLDAQVSSSINTLKSSAIAGGVHLTPPKLKKKLDNDANRQVAEEIADWLQDIIDKLETPIEEVLWDILDALFQGNKLAELVYDFVYGDWQGPRIGLRRIHVKPRDSFAYVVDQYNALIGVLPTNTANATKSRLMGKNWEQNIIPIVKFAILTFRPKNGDPRGTSILRAAYFVWWIKQQMIPEWLKYLAQFATAIVVGYTPEGADDKYELDPNTGEPVIDPATGLPKVETPEQAMVNSLIQLRNGGVVSFPFSAKVDVHFSQGGGEAFLSAFDEIDRWISKAILHQTLATGEGEHQARSAAEVHQDILGMLTSSIKLSVARMIQNYILRPLVEFNWGSDKLFLTPDVSLGEEVEQQDFASASAGISNLYRVGYIDPSQITETDKLLGLPPRSPDIIKMMVDALIAKLGSPTTPTPPQPAPGEENPPTDDDNDGGLGGLSEDNPPADDNLNGGQNG